MRGSRARRFGWTGAAALVAVAVACGGDERAGRSAPPADAGVAVVDDAGRAVRLPVAAGRVVSLVPSVTETIVALGAADRLIARTRYDRAPELERLPSVGGGLDPSVERLAALAPDLVVAWDARDDRALRPRLATLGIPVYTAAIEDTADVFATIERFGELLGRRAVARALAGALRDSLAVIAAEAPPERPAVFYLIAGEPPRTAGAETFIGQVVEIAGGRSAFPELRHGWPAVSLEAVVARRPDVVIVPVGEGLPGAAALRSAPGWRDIEAVRANRVVEIEADLFARPGPGIARAARALRTGLEGLREPDR